MPVYIQSLNIWETSFVYTCATAKKSRDRDRIRTPDLEPRPYYMTQALTTTLRSLYVYSLTCILLDMYIHASCTYEKVGGGDRVRTPDLEPRPYYMTQALTTTLPSLYVPALNIYYKIRTWHAYPRVCVLPKSRATTGIDRRSTLKMASSCNN